MTTYQITSASTVATSGKRPHRIGKLLWVVQALLALTFICTGVMKLTMPLEAMTMPVPLPGLFVRFVGLCESLGAIGLILPALSRIRPGLTPLAACGLVVIMVGATTLTAISGPVVMAALPLIVGSLAAFVAYGRWHQVPISPRTTTRIADPVRSRGHLAAVGAARDAHGR